MTINKQPNAIQVNGALVFVRDPEAGANDLFANWRRLGGLGNFTLPSEAGSTTETALIDGSISFANVTGVGNISGAIPALNAGAVHEFMERKSIAGGQIQISLVRPAVKIAEYKAIAAATVLAAADSGRIAVPDNHKSEVKSAVRAGQIVAIWLDESTASEEPGNATAVADALSAAAAANDALWQTVLEIYTDPDTDALSIDVAPGFSAAQTVGAGETARLVVRNPGRTYHNVLGSVNQWDRGDNQAGGGISGNMQIVPNNQVPVFSTEQRLVGGTMGSTGGIFDGYTRDGGFVL